MSARAWLVSMRRLGLLALGLTALGWLGGEILDGFGETRSHAAGRPLEIAALLQASEAPDRAAAQAVAAAKAAEQALADSPLDSGALALLGLSAAARDEPERAKALMQLAAARAPADLLAQSWLFHQGLMAEDLSGALVHADAMLRAQPAFLERLMPSLAAIAADPRGQAAMAGLLAEEPPWRSRFLERLAAEITDPLAPFDLYASLLAGSQLPSRAELRPYLARLVSAGLYEQARLLWTQARLLWTQALPAERLAEVGYLANGGFEQQPTGFLFDWSLEPVVGARAEIATIPEGDGGRGLRIQFHDRPVTFRHVRQLLMLMPGRYRLTGRAKAEGLRNPRGLHWTLSCADEPQTQLGASDRLSGTTRWHSFDVAFEVPASGCRAQWLRLELAARIAAERHAAGAAWYDDLAVARVEVEEEDSCPDEGWPPLPPEAGVATIAATSIAPEDAAEDEAAECTCAAPVGTSAKLVDVAGDVVVFRGEESFPAEQRLSLAPGDRVMVRAGGRALLEQGECRFDLLAQSVLTLREDECILCAAVATAGEAEVAYGQSAGGALGGSALGGSTIGGSTLGGSAVGGGATGLGVVGSPTLLPVATRGLSPLSGLVLGLPGGDSRPPTSQ